MDVRSPSCFLCWHPILCGIWNSKIASLQRQKLQARHVRHSKYGGWARSACVAAQGFKIKGCERYTIGTHRWNAKKHVLNIGATWACTLAKTCFQGVAVTNAANQIAGKKSSHFEIDLLKKRQCCAHNNAVGMRGFGLFEFVRREASACQANACRDNAVRFWFRAVSGKYVSRR